MDLNNLRTDSHLTFPVPPGIPQPALTRIGIITSNRMQGELLRAHCVKEWNFDVVAWEQSGEQGLRAISRTKPELILAALMPLDVGIIEFVSGLRKTAPFSKIILFISKCSEYIVYVLSALDHHALILDGAEDLNSLAEAIARVRQGHRFVSSPIRRIQNQLRSDPEAFHKILSPREKEVLALITLSKSNEEIAQTLCCSISTAQTHRGELMRKLKLHSTPDLIRYGTTKGFDSAHPFGLLPEREPRRALIA